MKTEQVLPSAPMAQESQQSDDDTARLESSGISLSRLLLYASAVVGVCGLVIVLNIGFSAEFAALFCLVLGGLCIVLAAAVYSNRLTSSKPEVARQSESGHVMVEFALSYTLVLLVLFGTIGFGLTFFRYNQIQSSIRSAARFASLHPYDLPNGTDWKASVAKMAVYGDPAPPSGAAALIDGLSTSNITVTAATLSGVPETVSVSLKNYTIYGVVRKFTISKPKVTFPYLGRVVVK